MDQHWHEQHDGQTTTLRMQQTSNTTNNVTQQNNKIINDAMDEQ
jgi:hypothetical protein